MKCVPGPVKFAVVPDKKRKKHYYMSAAQKRHRRDHEAFESCVFNLTLDINNLRQEVMRLLEFRDLQVTRLLLTRMRMENELLKTVEAMIRGVKENNTAAPECRVSRTIKSRGGSARGAVTRDGVYEFVTRLDKAHFSGVISSMQAVFAEDEESGGEAAAIRRVCGAGGCMIEVAGQFTFPFMHHLAMALFPHAAGDEMLLSRVIGLRMTCPIRFFLYFNAQRELVRQMAHADMLPALREACPKEIDILRNSDRFQEVHDT
ncbi:hypothetical protein PHYSODRAFT_515164 [Phytophthora sojae]|uniref:Uncharacterized protein n=1 Tax=Phytophthora sojae (strain P6497) TaxID=1094619 RepID=G4ZW19_PHYSP|nr:hypothetical protein PHYSODRAFT_515164 [Phytophthora sojae]EGZ11599.1 hypothetical protein PHYSODRAFT_515164 [Phytophthora sojae]|eukprot:XP_009531932.1 hypothetical protein PHYSODRAFT_515164 [Phytophthora sojae]